MPATPNSIQRVQPAELTPLDLLHKAVELNADIEKISRLMDLQLRWEQQKAQKAYVEAMARFRTVCPNIFKTKSGHNSMYAPLSEIVDAIKGAEMECGLDHTWHTEQSEAVIKVFCRVTHMDGHFEETSLAASPDTSGNKNAIQAIGSTVSYLQRYTLCSLFGIASQDMDDDGKGTNSNGANGKPNPQNQLVELLVRDAWENYRKKGQAFLAPGSAIDYLKFKNEIRAHFKALPANEQKAFGWHRDEINALAEKVNVNKVIVKKGAGNVQQGTEEQ